VAECCIYYVCIQTIRQRESYDAILSEREEERRNEEKETDDFLVNISHELRTPVNVVNGVATLILQNENREDIASIRDAGFRLAHQIEDIQDYTDIQRQDIPLEEDKYLITSLINDILVGTSSYINQNKLEFIIDLNPNVPSMMKGDIKKLHKIIRHLIDNALNFTRNGGVYLKIDATRRDYGINLNIEVSDTGIGMTRKEVNSASNGLYQANKTRNRSTGGIGIGLNIVYGFVRRMGGFVQIQSVKGSGTTVRVSVPQEIINPSQCLYIDQKVTRNIVFYVRGEKFKVPQLREFYGAMAFNLAAALKQNLYSVNGIKELKKLLEKKSITHIFTGPEEYLEIPFFFDKLSDDGIIVTVAANPGFKVNTGSRVIVVQKPLYGYAVVKVLSGEITSGVVGTDILIEKPEFKGLRALVVDDEPMNLVVATGIMKNYGIITDTADSGKDSIQKISDSNYDVVFMDHMMPEMDGVEAMKAIKQIAHDSGRDMKVIALTANAVAGAREMFIREGFDGFISKPISISDFEKVMMKVLPNFISNDKRGGQS
jgi:CheY-like chemotaxis protein/nitrogen-specific signal transduction histidine kinase